MEGKLDLVAVLLHAEGDQGIGLVAEIALELGYLFLSIGVDIFRQTDFFLSIVEIHRCRSFLLGREARSAPCAYYTNFS